jgi:hypothetical protein
MVHAVEIDFGPYERIWDHCFVSILCDCYDFFSDGSVVMVNASESVLQPSFC